jgi:NAD(P)-dependent dehydrogenase (short-subunit alcohol dehydrogenase family)
MAGDAESSGNVAVITGGASGLGLALAQLCASRGMTVALLDLDGERAAAEAGAIAETSGLSALGLGVDVADAASVDAAVATIEDRFTRADLVISNVGVQLFGSNERLTDDEWRWVLDVNVIGSARIARAFLPLLRRSSHGRLAFTTSSSVLSVASHMAAYQTSKFAVWGLAECLRLELAEDEISVSVIFPSGMISRHIETSEGAQPEHLRRPIATEEDFVAMVASNPGMTESIATAEDAALAVLDAVLAGKRYVVTHGDLVDAVEERSTELRRAAETAR